MMICSSFVRALIDHPPGAVARHLSTSSQDNTMKSLLQQLRQLDTASICDAEKVHMAPGKNDAMTPLHHELRVLEGVLPRNRVHHTMAGLARTVQLTQRNDFLAVLRGLAEASQDEVLMVNTLKSTRAVAGELFACEASRRGVCGIVIDGPMRDTAYLDEFPNVACYSRSITPYSGTIQSVGEMQLEVECGGETVHPGEIVMGDIDGIVVGCVDTFSRILETARDIQALERAIKKQVSEGKTLQSMTTYEEHLTARMAGLPSDLEFLLVD